MGERGSHCEGAAGNFRARRKQSVAEKSWGLAWKTESLFLSTALVPPAQNTHIDIHTCTHAPSLLSLGSLALPSLLLSSLLSRDWLVHRPPQAPLNGCQLPIGQVHSATKFSLSVSQFQQKVPRGKAKQNLQSNEVSLCPAGYGQRSMAMYPKGCPFWLWEQVSAGPRRRSTGGLTCATGPAPLKG